MPASDVAYYKIRYRHMRDALQLLECMVHWREAPRDSHAHRTGRSDLSTLYAKIKQGWEADGIPMPTMRASTRQRIDTVVMQRGHPRFERKEAG